MFVVNTGGVVWVLVILLATLLAGLRLARYRHESRAMAAWRTLEEDGDGTPFTADMVDGLPEPARRYLLRAIRPGTPLAASVRLTMEGSIRTRPDGDDMPLRAEQILSAHGLVWKARAGTGPLRIVGFDRYMERQGEMRWWLAGLIPVASAAGPDVSRSAAGRVAGESVLLPSLLLPQRGARWAPLDDLRARVTRWVDGEEITLTLSIDTQGRLTHVTLMRWRDDAGAGEPGPVRFDVLFDGELERGGYRVPASMRAGWRLGAADEFEFFQATVTEVRYR